MIYKKFLKLGEYGAAGMYEEEDRGLFYRKALGIRRYYENCEVLQYNGEYLYPSGILTNKMMVVPDFSCGMSINYNSVAKIDKVAADAFVSDFYKYKSTVPDEHTVAGNMYTHSMPNYERILKEGLLSYKVRTGKIKNTDLREGLIHVICGIENYIARCVSYLKSINADKRLISALGKVPMHPAENIYEALVGWNFILYLDNCDNLGCIASGLYPYYKGEDITDILKNLYNNLDANNGYSMALGTDYNPLTLQCLEASKGKRRPMIELFINDTTPQKIWNKAFEVIKTSNGQPAFYNEKALLDGLKDKIKCISNEDIKKFCGGGCTESMIAGMSNVGSLDAGINLLLILENVIYNNLTQCNTFEEFYNAYIMSVSKAVSDVTTQISHSQKERAKLNPLPLRTLLIDDCIDSGIEYNNGGARYKWSIINFAGMINVIDSMLVIRDFIFSKKIYSADKFIHLLKIGDDTFLDRTKNYEVCFGKDNDAANSFSKRISNDIYTLLNDKKPYIGECFLPASIQFNSQIDAGKNIGATPDGRKSAEPLCDSLGAIFSKDINGPTALLKSVASLELKHALGVPVLNFNINSDFNNEILKSLILGYMNLGGIQMQITCTSAEMLKEAYKHPDMYKNLVIRVGGYSEYFCKLSDELKKMIISRTIHQMR